MLNYTQITLKSVCKVSLPHSRFQIYFPLAGVALIPTRFIVYQLVWTSAFGPGAFTSLVLFKALFKISGRAGVPMPVFKAFYDVYIPHAESVAE